MTIQWFPGHMAKAKRILKKNLKMVDIVLELLDARIPYSSSNPDLDKLVEGKQRITILNKKDLANPGITQQWVEHLGQQNPTFAVDTLTGHGLKDVMKEVQKEADKINSKLEEKGRNPRDIRLLIMGIPNVGKSALINKISGRSSARVGNKPGVTRGKQWIKVKKGLQLLDSPGILWPRFESEEVGLKLATTGAVRSEVFDEERVAFFLVQWIMDIAPDKLAEFFGIELERDAYETMLAIGRRRGFLQSGGRVKIEQTSQMILKEFRDGRIGQISLERPGEVGNDES